MWERYFEALEGASPAIEAIGVTDYYLLDTYEAVAAAKAAGRLPNVRFIFPNVELRLATGTDRAKAINFHLLINSDVAGHIAQIKRFLGRLTFRYRGEEYACREDDLRALGRVHHGSCCSDQQALRTGVNQFKVEFDSFVERWEASEWIQRNALVAVATGRVDGTAGLQKHASLAALRQKIEAAAHIMFASSPKERDYWLGRTASAGPGEIIETYTAQYLSQQFVETLCSASGATDSLVAEVERVIFSAHPAEARQGAVTFQELLDAKAALGRQQRDAYERSIVEAAEEIADERDKIDGLARWRARSQQLEKGIYSDEKSKRGLITKGEEEKARAFEDVSNAAESLRQAIAQLGRRGNALRLLQAHVREHRETIAPGTMRRPSRERQDAALSDVE